MLAETYFYEAMSNWSASPEAAAERLFQLAQEAAQLDDQSSGAHLCLAWGYWRNYEMAEAQIEEAIALNPNDLDNYCFKGWLSTCAGNLEDGIWCSSQAVRRAPNLPEKCLHTCVMAEYLLGRYEQAITTFGRMVRPPVSLLGWVAACYAELGRTAEAHAAIAEFRARSRAEATAPPYDDIAGWRAYWAKCFPAREPRSLERLFVGCGWRIALDQAVQPSHEPLPARKEPPYRRSFAPAVQTYDAPEWLALTSCWLLCFATIKNSPTISRARAGARTRDEPLSTMLLLRLRPDR
jgi:tetratricopeptide (TPR) repeat protein